MFPSRFKKNHFLYSWFDFPFSRSQASFTIQAGINNFLDHNHLLWLELAFTIAGLLLLVSIGFYASFIYQRVIRPISEFSKNLGEINHSEPGNENKIEPLIDLQSSRIRELESANLQFKTLMHEIKKLKISIYENELEKQRFQITFLQHQIRPHFYLNCLTTISSMAALEDTGHIQDMVLFTSRYLRYLFQASHDFVPVRYELSHIKAYLDIQNLRIGYKCKYECNIEKNEEMAMVPPLLLITFIENIVKHSVNPDDQSIRIEIQKTERGDMERKPYLQVDITDHGQGFPPELLETLKDKKKAIEEDDGHIGIRNSMKRLNLMYHGDYELLLDNGDSGDPFGARVRIILPYRESEDSSAVFE